jgi:hypothetical protein
MTERLYRRPKQPALFWMVFGLVAVMAASAVAFLAIYS